jgi:hypothetical protein
VSALANPQREATYRGGLTAATELQLAAGTLEEHHQLRGYLQGDFASKVQWLSAQTARQARVSWSISLPCGNGCGAAKCASRWSHPGCLR